MDNENSIKRIGRVIDFIYMWGGIDGGHHKQWVLDQILRILMTEDIYKKWIAAFCDGEEGPNTYSWDEGIAP
ncbi:MAG: hypothetical protein GY853_05750 [PVC group bacterium]|nr:hypothetical protein [PVC group bacterium]